MSIKLKVLLGISALLILAIAANLSFSNFLITADKKAYIFENILKNTEEINAQLERRIREALVQSEAFVLGSQSGAPEWKELFYKQFLIDGLIFSFDDQSKKTVLKRSFVDQTDSYSGVVEDWSNQVSFLSNDGIKIGKVPERNTLEILFSESGKSLALLINAQDIFERITSDLVFEHFVIDEQGQILWQTSDRSNRNIIDSILKLNLKNATSEVNIGDESYLISTQEIVTPKFRIISFIPSSKAYSILRELNFKSLAFGLVLLGCALLLGLIFSIKLSRPIQELVQGTQFIADGNFEHKVQINTSDELKFLGDKFNYMSEKVFNLLNEKEDMIFELKAAKDKIEDYSKNLEKMVEARTAELKSANDFIQAMINSLDQGLLVFDKDLKCADIYTRACENLFEKSPAGMHFCDVLDYPVEQKEKTMKWADILFGEKIPFESAAQLGPKEKKYGDDPESYEFKVLSIHYHPMRGEDNKIQNVVAVVTDKTEEIRAVEQTKKKERFVEMISKILASKKQFIDFLQESQEFLHTLEEAVHAESPNLDQCMLVYHSFNGGFGMYGVDSMVDAARAREQFIVDLKHKGEDPAAHKERLISDKEEFKTLFENFKTETFKTLGMSSDVKEIDKALLLYIEDLVKETNHKELKYIFEEKIVKEPIEEFLTPYKDLISSLAIKLGKEIAPLKISGGDIRVHPDQFKEFFSLLVHLFRNCVDHGIESPFAREEVGKAQEGHINISAEIIEDGQVLKLVVEDDGGGIKPDKIREKLREKRPEDWTIDDESDGMIIYHIFDQDFSTAETVTSISGRGVGMSAIKDVVDRMNGKIVLQSEPNKGSQFIFELPIS